MTDNLIVRIHAVKASVSIFQALDIIGKRAPSEATQQIKCPIHRDRTPSARVYAETGKVYCFRCAQSWDVVGLIAAFHKISTEEAVSWLEGKFQLPPVGEVAPSLVKAVLTQPTAPDFSTLVESLEAFGLQQREAMGAARYHRFWLALDLATSGYQSGAVPPERYQQLLTDLRAFAQEPAA